MIEDLQNKKKFLSKSIISLSQIIAISATLGALIAGLFSTNSDYPYFDSNIKDEISIAISNNADIEVIKNIYENREIKGTTRISLLFDKKSGKTYFHNTPLSKILKDLYSDIYLNKESIDSNFLLKVEKIIKVHEQLNPFDKLQDNQKYNFENLQIKLKDKYSTVQNDVIKITNELYNKNMLVEKYLNKSNTSFWISIIALIVTIILSCFSIYQNRDGKFINLMRSVLNSNGNKSENNEEK